MPGVEQVDPICCSCTPYCYLSVNFEHRKVCSRCTCCGLQFMTLTKAHVTVDLILLSELLLYNIKIASEIATTFVNSDCACMSGYHQVGFKCFR